jgi:hypothetical protein
MRAYIRETGEEVEIIAPLDKETGMDTIRHKDGTEEVIHHLKLEVPPMSPPYHYSIY